MPLRRSGRGAAAAALCAMLMASAAVAGTDRRPSPHAATLASVIKAPVKVLTKLAVTEARLERDVSIRILHAGVDLFTRSVRKLSRRRASPDENPPVWDLRYW